MGFPLNAYISPHLNVHKYKDIISEVQMLKRNTNFGLHTLITFLVFLYTYKTKIDGGPS